MKGIRLKAFYSSPLGVESLFNEWVQAHPNYQIVDVKIAIDPNPDKTQTGDVLLLIFYYPN